MTKRQKAKVEFGKQLRKYRDISGLTVKEFGLLHNTTGTYITTVENGKVSVGIDIMEKYADSFGVVYYNMANPKFPVPTYEQLPPVLRRYIKEALKKREERKNQPRKPLADYLDQIIATDYLKTPRTGAMLATKINEAFDIDTTSGKVTALLTRHPRNQQVKLVDRPEGETAAGNWYQLIG